MTRVPERLETFADDDAEVYADIVTGLAVLGACAAGVFLAIAIGVALWAAGFA